MTGQRWLIVVAVALLLAGSGCVSCNHTACKPARDAGPDCPVQFSDRQHTYVFLINGITPSGSLGLEGLRDKLAEHGYTKVYCGQLAHAVWFAEELRRVHKEDPQARFVVVGYDLGGSAASRIANDAAADGLPIDAVVLLDPMGKPAGPRCTVRTLLVCSGGSAAPVPHTESLSVPEAGHFTLPTHERTVAVLCELLGHVAQKVEYPEVTDLSPIWQYEHATPPRKPSLPGPDADPQWSFLLNQPGSQSVPLTPPDGAAVRAAKPDLRNTPPAMWPPVGWSVPRKTPSGP